MPETQKYVSVPEAARRLGLHPNTVYRLIEKGKIIARRSGPRSTVIDVEELDKIVVVEGVQRPIVMLKEDLS